MIEATGREFLTRPQRREAREQALSRADQEARSGRFRRMKQVPVFWDLKRNEVYLGSAGSTVIDHFLLLFRETFDLTLTAASSGELANRWVARTGEHHAFEDCRPAHFINPPEDLADSPDAPGQTDETASNDFLGTEWLTWLWYASHVESPTISVPGGDPVTVLFEKSLQMQCAFRLTGSMAINADAPTRLPEAMVALAGGKRPVRAAFQIERHGDVFGLAIRGDAMNFSSIRVPPPEEADSPRLVFEDRIEKLRDLISAIDDLYAAFLKRRLSGKWSQTLHAMRSWIGSNRPAGATTGHDTPALLEAAS